MHLQYQFFILQDSYTLVNHGDSYVRGILIAAKVLIVIVGLPINWFLILLVIKNKTLHTLSFAVAMQVVVLNVFIVSILVSLNIISLSANRWLFGEYVCAVNGALNLLTYFTRIFLMLVLVIDRFMTVSIPYFYPKYRRKVVFIMSSIVWLLLGSYCIILLPGMLDCYAYSSFGYLCLATPSCSPVCNITLNVVSMLLIPAIIVPTILYVVLFRIARKSRSDTAVAANDTQSGAREWRAICLMFAALFLLIVLLFIWIGIYFLVSLILPVPQWFDLVTLGFLDIFTLLSIMDPIFIMRNRDVRDVISEIMQKVRGNNDN